MRTAKLCSSCGHIVFDIDTGLVVPDQTKFNCDGGGSEENPENGFKVVPYLIDVAEWRRRYPGEDMVGVHDILDFGFWYFEQKPAHDIGKDGYDYKAPCEAWRKDREARIAEEKEAKS